MSDLKVLYVITVELGKNGIASCVLNYARKLKKKGLSISIAAPEKVSDTIRQEIEADGVRLVELPFRKNNLKAYVAVLYKELKREHYDIVHVHGNSCTMAIELLIAELAGCRVRIAHSHNTTCIHKRANMILRPLFELTCNGRVACGDDAGKWLFQKKPFTIVKNGIRLDQYRYKESVRQHMRQQLDVRDEDVLLGHVGLFNEQKNHSFLIDVFAELYKKDTNYKLLCIGDGPERHRVEEKVEKLDLQKVVIFTGNVDRVSDYLQAMDCFLMPSLYEGVPFAAIEAQAAGLPVIVSDQVSDEVNISGHVKFCKLDRTAWCDAVQKESLNRENNENMLRDNGYDIMANAEELKSLYEHMIGGCR